MDRLHTVVAAGSAGEPLRVICGFCRSEHNYRGGPRLGLPAASPSVRSGAPEAPEATIHDRGSRQGAPMRGVIPIVSDRERSEPAVMIPEMSQGDLELLLRRVIREESGITPVAPAEKWQGGTPARSARHARGAEKSWPIETFSQGRDAAEPAADSRATGERVRPPRRREAKLQAYRRCYGTLTSFNVLFADRRSVQGKCERFLMNL
jgi:hypothetical protein